MSLGKGNVIYFGPCTLWKLSAALFPTTALQIRSKECLLMTLYYVPSIRANVRSLSEVLREKPDANINNYNPR